MTPRSFVRRGCGGHPLRVRWLGLPAAGVLLLTGCGDGSSDARQGAPPDSTTPAAPATARITLERPADGTRLEAREAPDGTLRAGTRLRGRSQPGSRVFLSASCRPARCEGRATAGADGRWDVRLTLVATKTARTGSPRASSGTGPGRTLPRDVLVIGDSLATGMAEPLRAALPGWRVRVDARIGRPLAEGMRILAEQRDPPAIIAFSLFTNDDPRTTAALERAGTRA